MSSSNQSSLSKVVETIKKNKWKSLIALIVATILALIFFLVIKPLSGDLILWTRNFGETLRAQGWISCFYLIPIVVVLSFPFTIGYSLALYLCGFVLGFPYGWIPAFIGAMIGAFASFVVFRHYFANFVKRRYGNERWFKAMKKCIQHKGFRFLLLVRFSPFSYGLLNGSFAIMDVKLSDYMLATAISLVKILWHIYIGSSVLALTGNSESPETTVIPLVIGTIITIIIGYTLIRWIRAELNLIPDNDLEEQSIMHQSPHGSNESFIEIRESMLNVN